MTSDPISDAVFIAFNQAVVANTSGKREGIFHVSDLIQPKCARNVYYSKKDPAPRMDGETAKNFYCGNIVHEHSQLTTVDLHEQPIIYNPFEDKVYPYKETIKAHPDFSGKDGFWYSNVIGKPDDIILLTDSKNYIIADKKTKLSKPESLLLNKQFDGLKPEHKSQLSMYRLMLFKAKGIDAKDGCILSLDYADKFKTPKMLPFQLDDMDVTRKYMQSRVTELCVYLKANKLPPRTIIQWMCNSYCPYYSMCFDKDGVDFKK